MSIMGFIVHTLPQSSAAIEKIISTMPEISTYGIHNECYIVAVAEAPSNTLELIMNQIKAIDDVLGCYVTSVHTEG